MIDTLLDTIENWAAQSLLVQSLIVLLFVWGFAFLCLTAAGWKQRIEGGGTWRRLLSVSVLLGLAVVSPIAVTLLSAAVIAATTGVSAGTQRLLESSPLHLGVASILSAVSLLIVARACGRPVYFNNSKNSLPLVEDVDLLAQVATLAKGLRIRPPRVRWIGSLSSSLTANAFAGGLVAPSLVVADGILHRLTKTERDAVLCHELAHIQNGSLWRVALFAPLASLVATLCSAFVSFQVALGLAAFFYVGISRFLLRRDEIQCDLAGGRCLGWDQMARSLVKIHAASGMPKAGILYRLVSATEYHPPLCERLAALRDASPPEQRERIHVDEQELATHRHWVRGVAVAWWLALAAVLVAAQQRSDNIDFILMSGCVASFFVPLILVVAAMWRKLRIGGRRSRVRSRWVIWAGVAFGPILTLSFIMSMSMGISDGLDSYWSLCFVAAFLIPIVVLVRTSNDQSKISALERSMLEKFQVHEFSAARQLGLEQPRVLAKSVKGRHNAAMAAALCGDRITAITELKDLLRDVPSFGMTYLTLGNLMSRTEPADGVEICRRAVKILPGDPAPFVFLAKCYRGLGKLTEAQQAIDEATRRWPDEDGTILAVASGIALDQGRVDEARSLSQRALELAPGDPDPARMAAELAIRTGSLDEARHALDSLITVSRNNPIAMMDEEIPDLEASLARRSDESSS